MIDEDRLLETLVAYVVDCVYAEAELVGLLNFATIGTTDRAAVLDRLRDVADADLQALLDQIEDGR